MAEIAAIRLDAALGEANTGFAYVGDFVGNRGTMHIEYYATH